MQVGKTLFAQVTEFVPWKTLGRIIERHRGDAGVRCCKFRRPFPATAPPAAPTRAPPYRCDRLDPFPVIAAKGGAMDEATIRKAQLDERSDLRKELQFLKECQFKYFSLAVTISGLIVGVADKFRTSSEDDRGVLLAPLLVVLPCWYILFDKATTITRMVGYLIVLEKIIAGDESYQFHGWENAVFKYRGAAAEKRSWIKRFTRYWQSVAEGAKALLSLRSANRYWVLCWLTFAGLSVSSLWLGVASSGTTLYAVSALLALSVAISTSLLLMHLAGGEYSYRTAAKKWEDLCRRVLASDTSSPPPPPVRHRAPP